ncbi:PAS domain S-box protein [Marinobacter litoralis]|uniref:PAS domain S-box protein n=1 Tax=Marinobacter litoralis TaxID=187981 RepID=UPI0018EE0343|nr:PAS domain S-box protein [Marinobacter litoralis]MBJ6136580.1 PAS domain S-box protein [Marinobacter litoralis]
MTDLRNRQALAWCLLLALGLSLFGLGALVTAKLFVRIASNGLPGLVELGGPVTMAMGAEVLTFAFAAKRWVQLCTVFVMILSGLLLLVTIIPEGWAGLSLPSVSTLPALPALVIIGCLGALLGMKDHPPRPLIAVLTFVVVTSGAIHLIVPREVMPFWAGLTITPNLEAATAMLVVVFGALVPFLPAMYRTRPTSLFRPVFWVGAIGIGITLVIWEVSLSRQLQELDRQANLIADGTIKSIEHFYEDELSSVIRMAERLENQGAGIPAALWRQETASYFRDLPFLEMVAILDHRMGIQRLETREFNVRFWLGDVFDTPAFRDWYNHPHKHGKPEVHSSGIFRGPDDQAWAFFSAPIRLSDKRHWSLLVLADLERTLERLSNRETGDFNLRLSSGERTLFDSGNISSEQQKILLRKHIDFPHDAWTLTVSRPRHESYLAQYLISTLILFGGLVMTALLMVSHLFGAIATSRNKLLAQSNHELENHLELEKELRISNQRIIDSTSDLLCSIDREGNFRFVSPASTRILGIPPEEMENRPIQTFIHEADWDKTLRFLSKLQKGDSRGVSQLRNRYWHRGGQLITLDWKARLSSDDGAFFCVGRDVTVELKAEELAKQREAFFSLTPEMFCIVSQDRFIEVNRAFLAALGYSREELIGRSYFDLIHPGYRHVITNAMDELWRGKPIYELEIQVFHRHGDLCWLRLNAALENHRIHCSARDITREKAIQKALREKDHLLSMAEKLGRLGGWVLNLDSRQTIWTNAVCDIHDLPRGEAPELDKALSYYTSEYRPKIEEAIQRAIELGLPFDLEAQIVTAKGRLRWVRAMGQAVRSAADEIVALQGAFQDITESKESTEQIRKLAERQATIFESITDGFFTLDKDWLITFANKKAEQLVAVPRHRAIGKSALKVYPQLVDSEFHRQFRAAMETGETASFEAYFEPRNLWLEVNVYPSEEGLAIYFRSVNERKQAEKERDASMAELKRSNRELQDFAFVASHDLQEPLRKIQAFGDRLLRNSKNFDEREQDYLRRMESAANRMQTLIKDLLSFSRISTRGQPFQQCHLNRILDEVLGDLETAIAESNARIDVSDLPEMMGDPSQLRQVFQNLLSNAIKFRRPDAQPIVRVYAEMASDQAWVLVVEDNGAGFDPKYAGRVFQPFQRLHSRSDYPGTGIGLAIVRKIIERHGGCIEAEGKPGSGAIFRVHFPRQQTPIATSGGRMPSQ